MAHPESTILSKDTGRAQSAALGVLGLFAATQVALVGRALWLAGAGLSPLNGEPTPAPQATPSPAVVGSSRVESPAQPSGPPVPGQLADTTLQRQPAPAGTATGWVVPTPGMLASDVVNTGHGGSANQPLTPMPIDPEVAELLETVAQLRASGDTSGVMDLLRAAEGMDQNNVAVLQEFAQTYEQMGLTDKAREYWGRIESQGPARAGAAYPLAQQRIGPSATPAPPAAPAMPGAGLAMPSMPSAADFVALPKVGSQAGIQQADGAVLTVGSCQVVRDLAVTTGERQTLRIPIIRPGNSETQIEPTAVNVDVFFYDMVNGSKVEPTRADPPVANWVAAPVDWAGEGIEPLDVVYFLPQMTADEIKNHGERRFHGYVVKLYYQNKLQVTAAEPSELLDMDATSASAPAASGS